MEEETFTDYLNPDSLKVENSIVEPGIENAGPGEVQFLRQGYFCADRDSPGAAVFNRTVALKDSWAKTYKGSG